MSCFVVVINDKRQRVGLAVMGSVLQCAIYQTRSIALDRVPESCRLAAERVLRMRSIIFSDDFFGSRVMFGDDLQRYAVFCGAVIGDNWQCLAVFCNEPYTKRDRSR